jgi:hypothetical protein
MPRKMIAMLFYLVLELGIFLIMLAQILALHPEFNGLIWDVGFATWCFIAVIIGWRIHYHAQNKFPLHHNYLYSRLFLFIWVLLFCYYMSTVLNTGELKPLFLKIAWVEFVSFFIGILVFHYVETGWEVSQSLGKWIRRQASILYVGITIALVVGVGAMLFPLMQAILSLIPKSILFLLHLLADHFEILFSWLQYIVPQQRERGNEESQMEFELGPKEELTKVEKFSFTEMGDSLLIVLLILLFCLILLRVWKQVQGMSFTGETENRYKTAFFKSLPQDTIFSAVKKKGKPKDRIRRQYHSLLQYAQKKGALIKQSDTAREWSLRLESMNSENWYQINQIYERKRYGHEEISNDEVIRFEKEIKKMKKQIQKEFKSKETR